MPFAFLNPGLLLGLAAAAWPIALHLLGRKSGRERRFAAIEFLVAADRRLRARTRLFDLLLLLARLAVVLSAVLVLARPVLVGGIGGAGSPPVSAVLILDGTASMHAVYGGRSALERAKAELLGALDELPPGSEAGVVAIERRPRRLTAGLVDPGAARAVLKAYRGTFQAGALAPAVGDAEAMLASARRQSRWLVVASDLGRSTVQAEDLGAGRADAVPLVLLDATGGERAEDLGLVAAVPRSGAPAALEVSAVRSHGGAGAEAQVALLAADRVVNRALLDFAGGRSASVTLGVPADIPAGAGARLMLQGADAMAIDDVRHLVIERRRRLRVLLGNGSPRPDLYQDEVFYLESALDSEPDRFEKRVFDLAAGALPGLDGADVVVLANPGGLEPGSARALGRFVDGGGGLLVTAGDRWEAAGQERAALEELLPARPQKAHSPPGTAPPVLLDPPPATGHPVLEPFVTAAGAESLLAARFRRLLAVDPLPGAEVVLRFGNGMPALVLGKQKRGRVALYASSVDRDWSDLPLRPGFVALFDGLVLWLGGEGTEERKRDYHPGDEVELDVSRFADESERVEYESPDGRRLAAVLSPGSKVRLEAVELCGPYRAHAGDRRVPELDFAVNLDPGECDLEAQPLAGDDGEEDGKGAGGHGLAALGGGAEEGKAALPLLWLLAAAVLAEAFLSRTRAATPAREGA